jgi:selenocysteine lyase/cysteine desulfurase
LAGLQSTVFTVMLKFRILELSTYLTMKKRTFLKHLTAAATAGPLFLSPWTARSSHLGSEDLIKSDVIDWDKVRRDYDLKPDYINLESGYYNIIPKPTMQVFLEKVQMVNYEGSYYMRTVQWENKKRITERLAKLVGCTSETIAITRNTTESLDLVIGGYPWESGDEAIFAEQDYGAMQDHFELVAQRFGVVLKKVSVPNHPKSDEEIVSLYESQITSKTRMLMICHMINITGQILPVRKICDMAHRHGVEVLVDGAHCIGHIRVDIPSLDCDYYGSSLHKWLSTPLGAGLLYVKKSHISKIWPLLAQHKTEADDMLKLNHTGTHPVHTDLAIDAAIDYLEWLDLDRKEARMRYLQRYWTTPLRRTPGILINTPEDPVRSCGIANVGVAGLKPSDLATSLLEDYGIFTVAIDGAGVHGCRITPNVFTTEEELDKLIAALSDLASKYGS